jgi:hypothetical protein
MRIVLVLISLMCLTPVMAACGEEEGGDTSTPAENVFQQRTRFYQLVCTCQLPEAQQNMVVREGAACVSDYVGGPVRRSCIVDTVEAAWDELEEEAECLRAVFEEAEECVTRPPGCPNLGNCLGLLPNATRMCGSGIETATRDCVDP